MINAVTLVGRLVKEPEVRMTNKGKKIWGFALANSIFVNGEQKTNFFTCTCYNEKICDYASKYLGKGYLVGITGSLTNVERTFEKDGKKVKVMEIIVSSVENYEPKRRKEETAEEESEPVIDTGDMPF